MLDKLPTELLLRTLELAAPLDYNPTFYLERRDLLLDCSLVSKKLCAIAQPMLPEVFAISKVEHVQELETVENGGKKGRMIKVCVLSAAIGGEDEDDEEDEASQDFVTLARLVDLMPAVFDLRLIAGRDLDLSHLARLPALRHLLIGEVDLRPFCEPGAIFQQLVELSTYNTLGVGDFPSATATPRLRALGIVDIYGSHWYPSSTLTSDVLEYERIGHVVDASVAAPRSTLEVTDHDLRGPNFASSGLSPPFVSTSRTPAISPPAIRLNRLPSVPSSAICESSSPG